MLVTIAVLAGVAVIVVVVVVLAVVVVGFTRVFTRIVGMSVVVMVGYHRNSERG